MIRRLNTYRIPEANFDALTVKLAKLNRRASKIQATPVTMNVVGEELELWYAPALDRHDRKRVDMVHGETIQQAQERIQNEMSGCSLIFTVRRYLIVDVIGEPPKLEGWTFAAVIQHTDSGNILSYVPGFDGKVPDHYRTADAYCDHCRLTRERKDTYVVVSDTGEWKQVGRQCLKDFIGHQDPHKIAEWAELLIGFGRNCEYNEITDQSSADRPSLFSLQNYLEIVAWCIRNRGWVGRQQARDSVIPKMATADLALSVLLPFPSDKGLVREWANDPLYADDRRLAFDAIEWAENIDNPTSDYLWNIRTLARTGVFKIRQAGLAASIVYTYIRERERQAGSVQSSQHIGKIGERLDIDVHTVSVKYVDTKFGGANLVLFLDQHGNRIKWWSSSWCPRVGENYRIRATIKSHDTYKGTDETVITRVSLNESGTVSGRPETDSRT